LADSGPGTLRAAIEASNASLGVADTISFAVGSGSITISPSGALPTITDPVTIDGWTQPGYNALTAQPLVQISGAVAGTGVSGLNVTAGNTTIRGLVINRFNQSAINLERKGNNTVQNCILGLNFDGTSLVSTRNGLRGIYIHWSDNNLIGGPSLQARNL